MPLWVICGMPDCDQRPPLGLEWVFTEDFESSHCGRHTRAEFVAHYQREGHRAAVLAYERLIVEAAMAWADGWSPWSMQGIRAARTLLTLTTALVQERAALNGTTAQTPDRNPDDDSPHRAG